MSSLSKVPLDETDYDSSPFAIHKTALEGHMERIEEFDLKTDGDTALHGMLGAALFLLSAHNSDLYYKKDDRYGTRWIDCLGDIRYAISKRAYSGEHSCNIEVD